MLRKCLIFLSVCPLLFSFDVGAQNTNEDSCSGPIASSEITKELENIRILLLGELHGTEEAPAIALAVACELSRHNANVVIALEMPENLSDGIEQFLDDEKVKVSDAILKSTYWALNRADGRTSAAMLNLIKNVKQNRKDGSSISIVGVDIPWSEDGTINFQIDRDQFMAERLQALTHSYDKVVFLAGNFHTRVQKAEDTSHSVVARYLENGSYLSVLIDFVKGTGWFCGGERGNVACKSHEVIRPKNAAYPPGVFIRSNDLDIHPYHGFVVLETVKASKPAILVLENTPPYSR